jgi:hypothetical protein
MTFSEIQGLVGPFFKYPLEFLNQTGLSNFSPQLVQGSAGTGRWWTGTSTVVDCSQYCHPPLD